MRSRMFGAVAVAALAAATLAACGSGEDAGSPATASAPPELVAKYGKNPDPANIVFAGNGGNSQKQMIEVLQKPFSQLTGDRFTQVSPPDIAQIQAQAAAGRPQWDVAVSNWSQSEANCGTLFDPIDQGLFDTANMVPVGKCALPGFRYANLLVFNPKSFPDKKPASVKDLFNTADFPGKRVIIDSPKSGVLEMALVADGVPPADLYPLDVPRALRKLDTIRSSLVIAASAPAQQNDLATGQAAMAVMTTTSAVVTNATTPITPVWDFTTSANLSFAILHNAKNKDRAQQFLAFVTEPSTQIAYAGRVGLGTVRKDVDPADIPYTEKLAATNAFQADRGTVLELNNTWWDANYAKSLTTWTKWKVS